MELISFFMGGFKQKFILLFSPPLIAV